MPLPNFKNFAEADSALKAKGDELAAVFAEAATSDDDGAAAIDFNLVTCLGKDVKGSIAVAEKVSELQAEMNEIGEAQQALGEAEKAAQEHEARRKAIRRPPFDNSGNDGRQGDQLVSKSLGEEVEESKGFKDWIDQGAPSGINIKFDDLLPSDVFAKAQAGQTIRSKTLFETTAGWAPESIRIPGLVVDAVTRPIQLLDILPLGRTGMDTIKYMEETTRTHAAAEKAEGTTFAESTFVLTERSSTVEKITDSLPLTDEQIEDVAQVMSYVNGRLVFGLRQRLDAAVLTGSGTTPVLRGIKNVSGIQTQAKGSDPVPDAVFKALTKLRVTGRVQPTHVLMHPTDWEAIRLLRTADGLYIWGNPSEAGPERMWGLPVVMQDVDSAGTAYVGSFMPVWCSLFERRGIDVQIGFTGTQFVEGKRTVRADMRMAFVVFRPAAFATVTGL